jgi:two-component system OmpR family sensor kinase
VSIRLRLTIYWGAITALILLTAGLLIMALFTRASWSALDAALMEEADTAAVTVARAAKPEASLVLSRLSQERDLGPGRRVRLIVNGAAVFDQGDARADLPAQSYGGREKIVNGAHGRYRYAIAPLSFNGSPAWLEDGADANPVRRTVAHLREALLLAIPIIFALSAAGGYWMAAWALTPLNEITRALARIGPRDLRKRLPVPDPQDETRRLITAINHLCDRLELASAAQQRFISEAAHELRTPLAVLRSGLEITLQRPRSIEESRAALAQAMSEVERLCAIAEDLLAIARLDADPSMLRSPVDLGEIAAEASAMARSLAEARHQEFKAETGVGIEVRGSAAELRRVLLNLLDNAVKFTPERGHIGLKAAARDSTAIIEVRDSGPGIAPCDLAHVFDPFFRSRSANAAGSGLGLALCSEIVRRHGGTIEASNGPDGGCEIRIRLPLANADRMSPGTYRD